MGHFGNVLEHQSDIQIEAVGLGLISGGNEVPIATAATAKQVAERSVSFAELLLREFPFQGSFDVLPEVKLGLKFGLYHL